MNKNLLGYSLTDQEGYQISNIHLCSNNGSKVQFQDNEKSLNVITRKIYYLDEEKAYFIYNKTRYMLPE